MSVFSFLFGLHRSWNVSGFKNCSQVEFLVYSFAILWGSFGSLVIEITLGLLGLFISLLERLHCCCYYRHFVWFFEYLWGTFLRRVRFPQHVFLWKEKFNYLLVRVGEYLNFFYDEMSRNSSWLLLAAVYYINCITRSSLLI